MTMKIYLLLAMQIPLGAWMWMMEKKIKSSMLHLQVILSAHPKGRKTQGKKGQAVRRTLATQMTPQWRVLDFPKGEFVVRDNQMWCSSCRVPIDVEHKNFGAKHLQTNFFWYSPQIKWRDVISYLSHFLKDCSKIMGRGLRLLIRDLGRQNKGLGFQRLQGVRDQAMAMDRHG